MISEKEIKTETNKTMRNISALGIICFLLVGLVSLSIQLDNTVEIDESIVFGKDVPRLIGYFTVIKTDGDGIKTISNFHNFITNAGRLDICDYLGGTSGASFDYIAIGTGSGQTVSSTTLATEIFRAQGTFAEPVAYNWTISYTWIAGTFSGEDVTEFGVFNAAASGTMLNYQDDGGRVLTASDSLQVIVEFMVSGG